MFFAGHLLLQLMYFITDFDGTVVHYEDYDSLEKFTPLPASSGSGRIGLVSQQTIEKLDVISRSNVTVICASGMRVSTMRQRQPYFPFIKYWICENGGLIFDSRNSEKLEELKEWTKLSSDNSEQNLLLRNLSLVIREMGYFVDDNYETMLRVKGNNFDAIIPLIPSQLKYTYNLGHLDIHAFHTGKLPAAKWLLNKIHGELNQESSPPYLFMGDDDNDIEIANAAETAYIVRPCSNAMSTFLSMQKTVYLENSSQPNISNVEIMNSESVTHQEKATDAKFYVAHCEGSDGTNKLLDLIKDKLNNEKL